MKWVGVFLLLASAQAAEQTVVIRWPSECLHLTQATYAEAPMVDGKPDLKHVHLYELSVDVGCGEYVVRH